MLLDPRLEADSSFIIDLALCQARLHQNGAFPWILLIPRQDNLSEIIDLSPKDQLVLMQEIALSSEIMQGIFQPNKLNVASLGNIVPQLHVHIVARYETDEAWPGPIWNSNVSREYGANELEERIDTLREAFEEELRKNPL